MPIRPWFALVALSLACGGDGDASPADASTPDAQPLDASSPPLWYVADSMRLAQTADEVKMLGQDLDGDGEPDNLFGDLIAALEDQSDLPMAPSAMEAVVSGRLIQLVSIATETFADAASTSVEVARGGDLDADAGDNFSGSEPFSIRPVVRLSRRASR
jgi:hypothetical protein